MNISKKDLQLLTGLLGVLAAALVFFLVYQPLTSKKDAMATLNQELQTRISELEDKVNNREFYISETDRMNKEMNSIYDRFPADVREEDAILLAGNMQIVAPLSVKSINIGAGQQLLAVNPAATQDVSGNAATADPAATTADPAATVDPAAAQVATGPEIFLNMKPIGIAYGVSYEGFKRQIQYICQRTDRMTIDTISAAYDESTGLLIGATNVKMFYVTGTGRTYKEPAIPEVMTGTKDLFGTISAMQEVKTQEEQSDQEEE